MLRLHIPKACWTEGFPAMAVPRAGCPGALSAPQIITGWWRLQEGSRADRHRASPISPRAPVPLCKSHSNAELPQKLEEIRGVYFLPFRSCGRASIGCSSCARPGRRDGPAPWFHSSASPSASQTASHSCIFQLWGRAEQIPLSSHLSHY